MTDPREGIQLLHPDPEKSAPRIEMSKYLVVKSVLLVAFELDLIVRLVDFPNHVRVSLSPEAFEKLDTINRYTTTVKLDMDAHPIMERIPGSKPQTLRL